MFFRLRPLKMKRLHFSWQVQRLFEAPLLGWFRPLPVRQAVVWPPIVGGAPSLDACSSGAAGRGDRFGGARVAPLLPTRTGDGLINF